MGTISSQSGQEAASQTQRPNAKNDVNEKLRRKMYSQLLIDKRFQSLHRQFNAIIGQEVKPEWAALILMETQIISLILHEPTFIVKNGKENTACVQTKMEWRIAPDYMNAFNNIDTNVQGIKQQILQWINITAPRIDLKIIFDYE